MIPQVPFVGEILAALVAHVGLLTGVYLLVGFQAVALIETAIAYVAGERLLPSVDALVSVQVAQVVERLPACVAGEWFLSCVNKLTEQRKNISGHHCLIKFFFSFSFFTTEEKKIFYKQISNHTLYVVLLC